MGRRKTSLEQAAAAGAAAARELADGELELGEPEMDALDALMAQLGGSGARIVIECVRPVDRAGRLETLSPEQDYDIAQYITDEYGPGKYKVYGIDARNRFLPGRHAIVDVSPLAKRNGVRAAAPAAPAGQPAAGTSDLVRELEARNEKARLEAREDRKFLLELFAPLGTALITGLLGRQPSLVDQAAALQALRPPGGTDAEKMITMFKQGMELAAGRGESESEGWPGVIREGVKIAGDVIRQLPAPAAAQPPAAPPVARIPLAPAQPQPEKTEHPVPKSTLPPEVAIFEPVLRRLSGALVGFAEGGAPADTAANGLLSMVPQTVRRLVSPAQLLAWLRDPAWWTFLTGFEPALAAHHDYCDAVRQQIIAAFAELAGEASAAGKEQVQ